MLAPSVVASSLAWLGDDLVSIAMAIGARVWVHHGPSEIRRVAGEPRIYVDAKHPSSIAYKIALLTREQWEIAASDAWCSEVAIALLRLVHRVPLGDVEKTERVESFGVA
jgi:hypothetical protein